MNRFLGYSADSRHQSQSDLGRGTDGTRLGPLPGNDKILFVKIEQVQ